MTPCSLNKPKPGHHHSERNSALGSLSSHSRAGNAVHVLVKPQDILWAGYGILCSIIS